MTSHGTVHVAVIRGSSGCSGHHLEWCRPSCQLGRASGCNLEVKPSTPLMTYWLELISWPHPTMTSRGRAIPPRARRHCTHQCAPTATQCWYMTFLHKASSLSLPCEGQISSPYLSFSPQVEGKLSDQGTMKTIKI